MNGVWWFFMNEKFFAAFSRHFSKSALFLAVMFHKKLKRSSYDHCLISRIEKNTHCVYIEMLRAAERSQSIERAFEKWAFARVRERQRSNSRKKLFHSTRSFSLLLLTSVGWFTLLRAPTWNQQSAVTCVQVN